MLKSHANEGGKKLDSVKMRNGLRRPFLRSEDIKLCSGLENKVCSIRIFIHECVMKLFRTEKMQAF